MTLNRMMGRRKPFVACKLCYLLRVKNNLFSLLYLYFFAFSFFEYAPKKSYVRSAKVDNDAWEGAWKIKLDILTLFYNYFSLKIGLASNLLDIVHKNFAERSTEEQVLERQRVSVDFCKEKRCIFSSKKQVMRLSIEPSRAGQNFRKAIDIFLRRLGRTKF